MWRSFFLAVGVFAFILGAECLLIDKAVLTNPEPQGTVMTRAAQPLAQSREFIPPPAAPWTLMSVGSVIVLYCFTLPVKLKG